MPRQNIKITTTSVLFAELIKTSQKTRLSTPRPRQATRSERHLFHAHAPVQKRHEARQLMGNLVQYRRCGDGPAHGRGAPEEGRSDGSSVHEIVNLFGEESADHSEKAQSCCKFGAVDEAFREVREQS